MTCPTSRGSWRVMALPCALAAAGLSSPTVLPAQPASLRDSASAGIATFLESWRAAWQASEAARHPEDERRRRNAASDPRLLRLHCHGWPISNPVEVVSISRLRLCPGWRPAGDSVPGDEWRDADAALDDPRRAEMRAARARLLDTLAALAARAPADAWLLGQRVRFLVDQREASPARSLVRACGPESWWCALLAGYVEHRLGSPAMADSAFGAALAAMPPGERCRWERVEPLLDDRRARERLGDAACDDRLAAARRFWWLADPLFSEPGNERRREHVARAVLVALRSAVPQDDRMHWLRKYGGDAMGEMVLRYGWPAYFWWGGAFQDQDHHDWTRLPEQHWGVAPRPTFWSAEYDGGRLHVGPTAAQWKDPFDADAWAPAGLAAPRRDAARWWPREHYAPATPLAALTAVQVALMRRQHGTLVVAATDPAAIVGRRLLVPEGDSLVAALVHTTGPDSVTILTESRLPARARVVVWGMISRPGPALGALELRPAHAVVAPRAPRRRARFGLAVPAPLSTLAPNERAISAPVLLASPDAQPPDSANVLSRFMLGGTALGERPRIGVYWETYGFAPQDTLLVTMRVVWRRVGLLARVGRALRVPGFDEDGRDAVAVRWVESPRGAAAASPAVPIRSWMRTLDLQALPTGHYHLEVAVASRDAPPVLERVAFTVGRE